MNAEQVRRMVRAIAAPLSHRERERLAMQLASEASGEEVQFLSCRRSDLTGRNVLTGWIEKPEVPASMLDGKDPRLLAAIRDGRIKDAGDYRRWKAALGIGGAA